MNHLVRCINCNVIYEVTPFDRSPEYRYSKETGEYYEIKKDDLAAFERAHKKHRKEDLTVIESSQYSEGAYFDPLRVTYIEATNGKETFLVKRWRKTVAEAVRYELVEGRMEVNRTVEIQERDLIKQLRYEINDPPLPEQKLYRFLEIIYEETQFLDLEHLDDELYESNEAQVFYLPLQEKHFIHIMKNCQAVFTRDELQRIERFMRNNCEYNGVMSFVVRKHATFYPQPLIISIAN